MPESRTVRIAVAAGALLILAAALIVPHFIDTNKYHNQVEAQLEKRLGRRVSLSKMDLSLFPPSFRAENATIAEDPRFNTGSPFATAEKLTVTVRFWPLMRNVVELKSLELDRPHIELVRNAQGVWNFDSLGRERKSTAPKKVSPEQITLDHLLITDGQVAITDLQQNRPRAVYDHIDLEASDFASDRQFSMKVSALLPGAMKQAILLEGRAGPMQADTLKTPFDGRLHLDQVPTSAAAAFLNSQALNGIDGVISGEAKVKNSGGKLDSSGTIRLDDLHIHNVSVGYPVTFDYDVSGDAGADLIQIRRGDVKLGTTPTAMTGWINTRTNPAQLDVKLTAANVSIGEAARLASAFGVVFGQGTDVTGQVNVNVQARGSRNRPVLDGQLSARDLIISGKDLAQPVKVGTIELTFMPDAIRSSDFIATTGTSRVSGNFELSGYSTSNSSISISLRTSNARMGDVLNIAKATGVSAMDGFSGDGTLGLDVHAQGPTKDLAGLSFSGKVRIQNATLKTPSLSQGIQIHNSEIALSQNSASLQNISAKLGPTNVSGGLTLKDFAEPQVQFTLNADKLDVAQLQQFFAPAPAQPAQAQASREFFRLIPQADAAALNEPGLLNRITGSGSVTIGSIQYDDLVLDNVHSKVTLEHGVARMNPVTADIYGGKESGNIVIDLRPAQPVYTANLKTEKADANKFISSVSSLKQTLFGVLAVNVNGTFSSNSASAIARSLNGDMELNLTNGKLMNLDLLHELAEVGKFTGSGKPANVTNLVQLSGNFNVRDGVARTSSLKATIDGGAIAVSGLVNLADQSIDLHVTAVLNKAMSEQVGGSHIGGFMNTALANSQGELVLPVILTGTFQHPQVAPDLQQITQMKAQNLLPTTKNPADFTSNVLAASLESKSKNDDKNPHASAGNQEKSGKTVTAVSGKGQQQPQSPSREAQSQVQRKKKKGPTSSPTPVPTAKK